VCISRDSDDIILYDASSSGYHSEHIIMHELGHLLLSHDQDPAAHPIATDAIEELLDGFEPSAIRKVLGRVGYDSRQEADAELFASLVMSESRSLRPTSRLRATFLRG